MTWWDRDHVASLRQSAKRMREYAERLDKYPPLSGDNMRLRAAQCDLRADEIERNLGGSHRSLPADSKLQGSRPKEDE